ncbi:hypothetical protein BWK60_01930 [Flavobacterium covae]|uniref:hypothetical protein n=1 Tax=Flavobacterium covae TaxID=2906076 RepID=UPI000B4D5F80|nr:hypothetical protein [Flavobacterium covae]OWP87772.1 hypothetical protein BWK60_01930 [Flavobacterium covae]
MTLTNLQLLINSIEDNGNNTASEMRVVLNALKNEICKIGEIRTSIFSPAYLSANFNSTGLGINEMDGFAICNGSNRTVDLRKRVPVGYDSAAYTNGFNYSILGNQFGEEVHTLSIDEMPAHDHSSWGETQGQTAGGGTGIEPTGGSTGLTGGSKPHNNMQPSTVVIFYQRIS